MIWYEGSGFTDRRWLHADNKGSVIAYTDGSGAAQAIYGYGAYGEPSSWAGSRYRYTGQIEIPEAQLYYYKARVYDPTFGRFLQTDPVGYASDVNAYAYTHNDPVNGSDPSGRDGLLEGDTIGSGIDIDVSLQIVIQALPNLDNCFACSLVNSQLLPSLNPSINISTIDVAINIPNTTAVAPATTTTDPNECSDPNECVTVTGKQPSDSNQQDPDQQVADGVSKFLAVCRFVLACFGHNVSLPSPVQLPPKAPPPIVGKPFDDTGSSEPVPVAVLSSSGPPLEINLSGLNFTISNLP